MSGLSPVAWMANPRRVRRKSARNAITSAAASRATIALYHPASAVPARASLSAVKTVAVLLRFKSEAPPMMAMLTEYRPVLTMMPESRLSMPMRVWSVAVTRPESTPAHIAAGRDKYGCPARAATAPVTAPRVKQPSVDRSQTPSIV